MPKTQKLMTCYWNDFESSIIILAYLHEAEKHAVRACITSIDAECERIKDDFVQEVGYCICFADKECGTISTTIEVSSHTFPAAAIASIFSQSDQQQCCR